MEETRQLVLRAADVSDDCGSRLEAFGRLVVRYQAMAYGYACTMLGDFHLAEDAAQEAFVIAYQQLGRLRHPDAFAGWLRRIVHTACIRQLRSRRAAPAPLEAAMEIEGPCGSPREQLEAAEMRQQVLHAIGLLPEAERQATVLFYINGYSQQEVADFLEVPVTTVNNRLHASRQRLKERMMAMIDETLKGNPLPEDFARLVVRRVVSQADLETATRILAPTYHGRRQTESLSSLAAAQRENVYLVEEGGKSVSAGWLDLSLMGIGTTILEIARPREFAGEGEGVPDPRFVRSVRGAFELARQRGISLSAVHGSMWDHAQCGYVPCFYYPVTTLDCRTAAGVESRAVLVEATDEQAEAARMAYLHDPFVPRMSGYIGGGQWHLIQQAGEVVGYARVNPDFDTACHSNMPLGYVCSITVQTREAALAVIRRTAELAEKAGQRQIYFMQSHMTMLTRTMLSLGGTYQLRGSCDLPGLDAEMVAVIDLFGLTQALHGEFQAAVATVGCAATGLTARLSIEMDGQIAGFVVHNGRLDLVAERQPLHLRLPRWLVTRLYMGYYSGTDLLSMDAVPGGTGDTGSGGGTGGTGETGMAGKLEMIKIEPPAEPAATLFRTLFPRRWPTSMPDPDVWRWVIGAKHPVYQHEEIRTPQTKAQIDALKFAWFGY